MIAAAIDELTVDAFELPLQHVHTSPDRAEEITMTHQTIEACHQTIIECQAVVSEMAPIASKTECPRCCVVCSEICALTINDLAREGHFAGRISALCAEICTWCAQECRREGHDHCVRCAEACDRCVEALAQVAE